MPATTAFHLGACISSQGNVIVTNNDVTHRRWASMNPHHPNPFLVGRHVSGVHFTDRAEETGRIRRAILEPSRLLVYGPRRMGKSSCILRAVERETRDGALVAWADFSTATTLTDVSNRLLKSLSHAMGRAHRERLIDFARHVSPQLTATFDSTSGLPIVALDVSLRRRPAADQRKALESVLDRLDALAADEGRPVAVVFDEFQDILDIGGDRADWFLRGVMQRHTQLSYICAGSKESLIHEMLGRQRAFYKHFELLHFDAMDPGHLATWIDDRMKAAGIESSGCGEAIVAVSGPRTQDRLQLAREVYHRARGRGHVQVGDVEAALDDIVRAEDAVHRSIWEGLPAMQQNALRALASSPDRAYSKETLDRFSLNSTAAMARSIEGLIRRGLLVKSSGRATFDSPFFRAWVERTVLPDTAPPGGGITIRELAARYASRSA